ncbi:MAG: choice-of-anchor D domain-containing protein [Proteobacteria bacterium]|nr:choice-of-anchor D domain-containing protein [Pseudomonadota bacterium]MCP4918846.1 choice-of-anchor D domain-containing protein [Pseudomonadota bacterium]
MSWILLTACGIENGVDRERVDVEEPTAELAIDPTYIDFGLVELGAERSEVFTVTAIGTAPVQLGQMELHGPESFDLSWDLPNELQPGESADVVVTYVPHGPDEPGYVALNSDAVIPRIEVEVWGGAIVPQLTIDPTSLLLQSLDGEDVTDTVTLASTGTATLELYEMLLLGDENFEVVGEVPATLEPGETAELEITWFPDGDESDTIDIWLTDNTLLGSALIPVEGQLVPPCLGLAEAWETDVLTARTSTFGNMVLTNVGSDDDICIDRWTVWLSEETQDMGLGDPFGDAGQVYPEGSLTMAPGESKSFTYGSTQNNAWYCVEQTQTTIASSNWDFFGARMPQPLMGYALAGDQEAIWNHMLAEPVFMVGRDINVVDREGPVDLRLVNMGREDGVARMTEFVPDGFEATDFTIDPDDVEYTTEGVAYSWDLLLIGAVDTGTTEHTIYDQRVITYTLERHGAECVERSYLEEVTATWQDSDGTERSSMGSPLLVICPDE